MDSKGYIAHQKINLEGYNVQEFAGLKKKFEEKIEANFDLENAISNLKLSIKNNETKIEVKRDITVQTNLLESRYLNGNKVLYKNLQKIINDTLIPEHFYQGKLKEQDLRHQKSNPSA